MSEDDLSKTLSAAAKAASPYGGNDLPSGVDGLRCRRRRRRVSTVLAAVAVAAVVLVVTVLVRSAAPGNET